jgi:tetratricopeptide (TPR) repeat protein
MRSARDTNVRHAVTLLAQLLAVPLLFAISPPRITFTRILPAAHSLGKGGKIAVIQAIGDHPSIETFVGGFVDEVNHSGFLEARDARQSTGPADVYLVVRAYRCVPSEHSGEASTRDVDGNRVKRPVSWIDVTCTARIEAMSNVMKYQSTFYAKGEGTSPRAESLTDGEREVAYQQAAKYAAIDAAERITPRKVKESIPLEENAPAFEDGYAMISADRLGDARRIWEREIARQPRSAPLRYNLAALCEAMGDRRAAATHYAAARDLQPAEPRYANELRLFTKRGSQ